MFLQSLTATATSGTNASSSIDMIFPSLNAAILTCINGIEPSGTPFSAFAGIENVVARDPETGKQISTEMGNGSIFECVPVAFVNNATQVTFVVGAIGAGAGLFTGSNFCTVSGGCQIVLDMFI